MSDNGSEQSDDGLGPQVMRTQTLFFGHILTSKKPLNWEPEEVDIDQTLVLTQLVLDPSAKDARVAVQVKIVDPETGSPATFVIGILTAGKTDQVSVNLRFQSPVEISLSGSANASVHLTGFQEIEFSPESFGEGSDDEEDDEDEDDEEEEEAPKPVKRAHENDDAPSGKKSKAATPAATPAKPAAAPAKAATPAPTPAKPAAAAAAATPAKAAPAAATPAKTATTPAKPAAATPAKDSKTTKAETQDFLNSLGDEEDDDEDDEDDEELEGDDDEDDGEEGEDDEDDDEDDGEDDDEDDEDEDDDEEDEPAPAAKSAKSTPAKAAATPAKAAATPAKAATPAATPAKPSNTPAKIAAPEAKPATPGAKAPLSQDEALAKLLKNPTGAPKTLEKFKNFAAASFNIKDEKVVNNLWTAFQAKK